jgi:tetratricopeptide (TPR) repeat protein
MTDQATAAAASAAAAAAYQAVSDEEQRKATAFFQKARTVGATGNFDFAIEMYYQGLLIDPENIEAHAELREIAMKRKASGGKAMGFFDARKHSTNNKDDKLNLVNAEKLLAYDPGSTDHMQALLQNAHKAGFYDTVMWIGPIFQKANADSKKPEFNKFIVLKDVYKSMAMDNATPPRLRSELLKRATNACHYAAKMKPEEMDLQTELKNLGALHTQVEGKYDQTDGSFRKSIKDVEAQEKLQAQDKGVQSMGVMGKLIKAAEAEYKADPNEPGKLLKLVDTLEKTEDPEYEGKAIELLTEWFNKTKQFRFRKRIGEINMRQWRRMEQGQKEYVEQNPQDAQAKTDYEAFKKDWYEFELSEYRLWAENYPTDSSFKFQAAIRMFELKQYNDAIPLFQQSEADAKYRTRARLYLGRSFFELQFLDEAVDTLDGLIRDYPTKGDDASKEMHYWAARAHEDRGDVEAAIKWYSAIVRMEFNFKDVQARIRKLRALGGGNAAAT